MIQGPIAAGPVAGSNLQVWTCGKDAKTGRGKKPENSSFENLPDKKITS
jgi:hypothetical protein